MKSVVQLSPEGLFVLFFSACRAAIFYITASVVMHVRVNSLSFHCYLEKEANTLFPSKP